MADRRHRLLKQLDAAAPDKAVLLRARVAPMRRHQPTKEWNESLASSTWLERDARRDSCQQKRLGVVPRHTAHPCGRTAGSGTLFPPTKKLFSRQAEVYAAYVAYTDHEIGRVIQAVDDLGKLDNTLVIYMKATWQPARKLRDRHAV